jgi:hypothetical protein
MTHEKKYTSKDSRIKIVGKVVFGQWTLTFEGQTLRVCTGAIKRAVSKEVTELWVAAGGRIGGSLEVKLLLDAWPGKDDDKIQRVVDQVVLIILNHQE